MDDKLTTEERNKDTMKLDNVGMEELLFMMNDEDAKVSLAVREQIPEIKKAVKEIITALKSEGRLIYVGAGTSGRIGLLDAVECPPTFGVSPNQVKGIMAGGEYAFIKAVEGAEDNLESAKDDLENISLNKKDVVVGIAASGKTPYVIGALEYANKLGAITVAMSSNKNSIIGSIADIKIELDLGPEVLSGSTRLKAGTAQKLICNMLSTASMVGIGKIYENLMVDLQPTNNKLIERSKRIIMEATSCDYKTADKFLTLSNNSPKVAIVMLLTGLSYSQSIEKLEDSNGFVREAVE